MLRRLQTRGGAAASRSKNQLCIIAEGELRKLILRFKRVAEFGWPEVTEAVPSESREELLNDWLQKAYDNLGD